MECRRSSRKKITKFDVRDLLNKGRKPHKIQIEARIDSASCSESSSLSLENSMDLTSKQKTFMEKSAIFRRYSISEQQSKIVSSPMRPLMGPNPKISLLDKSTESDGSAAVAIGVARRLSRTQEIFNASMMKSKQNSSLIVTQMESGTSAVSSKKKVISKTIPAKTSGECVVQKRRGRPPKIKPINAGQLQAQKSTCTVVEDNIKSTSTKQLELTSQTMEDWSKNKTFGETESTRNINELSGANDMSTESKLTKVTEIIGEAAQSHFSEMILEISSSSTNSTVDKLALEETAESAVTIDNYPNFESVSFMSGDRIINDPNVDSPELIFSGIEEIVTESLPTTNATTGADLEITTNENIFIADTSSTDLESDTQRFDVDRVSIVSSSSESDIYGGLERSGSGDIKTYKEGDELRVKLKRLSIPTDQIAPIVSVSTKPQIEELEQIYSKKVATAKVFNKRSTRKPTTITSESEAEEKSEQHDIHSSNKENDNDTPIIGTANTEHSFTNEINPPVYMKCDSLHECQSDPITIMPTVADVTLTQNITAESTILELNGDDHITSIVTTENFDAICEPVASSYKKSITLPIKKQVSKFKHFEITNCTESTLQKDRTTSFVSEPSFIKNVNVETSTLLDILRTVESNKIGQQYSSEEKREDIVTNKDEEKKLEHYIKESTAELKKDVAYTQSGEIFFETKSLIENLNMEDVESKNTKQFDERSYQEIDACKSTSDDEKNITEVAATIKKSDMIKFDDQLLDASSSNTNPEYIPMPSEVIDTPSIIQESSQPTHGNSTDDTTTELMAVQAEPVHHSVNKQDTIRNYVDEDTKQPKPPPKKRISKIQAQLQAEELEQSIFSNSNEESKDEIAVEVESTHSEINTEMFVDACTKNTMKKSKKDKTMLKQQNATEERAETPTLSNSSTPKRSKSKSNDTIKISDNSKRKQKKVSELSSSISEHEDTDQIAFQSSPEIESNKASTSASAASTKISDKKKFLEIEDATAIELSKHIDEKTAKKKRQKKLKEAFEAALLDVQLQKKIEADRIEAGVELQLITEDVVSSAISSSSSSPTNVLQSCMKTIAAVDKVREDLPIDGKDEKEKHEPDGQQDDEQPDPLKDIEKFIEDGVNLLKRSYKHDDENENNKINVSENNSTQSNIATEITPRNIDSKQNEKKNNDETLPVILTPTEDAITVFPPLVITTKREEMSSPLPTAEIIDETTSFRLFETPADTPIATPTVTPPPKSPVRDDDFNSSGSHSDETALRRSHRIKQITKTPKALVGRGLVRDKERISLKDDVETKSHYSLDDHLMDLAEVEAKNAKFLKDMEERLSNFHVIKENEYKCERIISKEARRMICDCFLTAEEEERGELGCGEDCLNRLLMIECGPDCNVKERCTNRRFQRFLCSPCRVFRTEKKGFGIMADIEILPGEFIMEYVGEVIDDEEFEQRRTLYSQEKNRHYYFMALRSDAIIDATIKGNISRFINHSCDPNAETQKWTVNGELRIGFFSRKSIMPGEEITFDYQYQRYGREAQRCYCESTNCRGWIGEEPNSDEGEGEQLDEDSDDDNLADSLLDDEDDDDDEDSDDSADAEAEKKLQLAAAEAKLFPLNAKNETAAIRERGRRKGGDEDAQDSKNKLKRLLSKVAEKVAKKKKEQKKQLQKEQKQKQRHRRGKDGPAGASLRHLEDPDIEDEVNFLSRCGVKNQSDTLRLSRLMVRAKLPQTRLNLLQVLRRGELPCRRLFLDYHGLRLLHGWMSEDGGDLDMRLTLLETLASLPIVNKTVLTETKVYHTVRTWSTATTTTTNTGVSEVSSTSTSTPTVDDSSKESTICHTESQTTTVVHNLDVSATILKLSLKLIANWENLPDIFRIPKRERIEQMKEHEREADRQYAAAADDDDTESNSKSSSIDRYQRDRFGRMGSSSNMSRYSNKPYGKEARTITTITTTNMPSDPRRRTGMDNNATTTIDNNTRHLSKEQRREMFAAKVARDEAEKRLAEERRDFETKCRFFGLDPKKTRPQDMPFCVVPTTGQWYSVERQPIITPPSYVHVQVPVKSKSTNPTDYQLPNIANMFPRNWRYAITPQGHIYYYHVQFRIPQWEPPSLATDDGGSQSESETDDNDGDIGDSSDDNNEDELIMGMDQAKLRAYIEKEVAMRRFKRYKRLVAERGISPRREEDRMYNQMEVRKYKENKEKIRKRKEEIRRRRAEAQRASALVVVGEDDNNTASTSKDAPIKRQNNLDNEEEKFAGVLPIQDYLLSSDSDEDEVETIKEECNNSPLIEKIVQGDKIVDELDALTVNRPLKRLLPPHRDLSSNISCSSSSSSNTNIHEIKKRKLEKKEKSGNSTSSSGKNKSKESDAKYRKLKEKFRCEIAGIIVGNLKPYRKDSCQMGRIQSDMDFNHLARKLTHFVMIKELKYCESVGQTLVVTESVKNKSREFIKKYMAKYGCVYEKPKNDPEFKDIPFSL